MKTTYDFIQEIVENNIQIRRLYFREYTFPAQPVGTEPALKDRLYPTTKKQFLNKNMFKELKSKLPKNRNLGIESRVKTLGEDFHIPMMDFSMPKSSKSVTLIKKLVKKEILNRFGGGGLFETDNSYHFIGNKKLLDENEYLDFLGWFLLLVYKDKNGDTRNIVDAPYIAYCLLKKSSCLRVTKYPNSKIVPSLIYLF